MKESYQRLLKNNRQWAAAKQKEDADYFKKLSQGQSPEYLWIGCSDSRVPANEVTLTQPGEIFVHRNIANVVIQTDMNLMSVLYFAVEILQVKHIIVCGHYECGGVTAAIQHKDMGIVTNWLRSIKEIYERHKPELDAIDNIQQKERLLVELNTIEQAKNLGKTRTVQRAWRKRSLYIHPWVFDCCTGIMTELDKTITGIEDVEPIFRYDIG